MGPSLLVPASLPSPPHPLPPSLLRASALEQAVGGRCRRVSPKSVWGHDPYQGPRVLRSEDSVGSPKGLRGHYLRDAGEAPSPRQVRAGGDQGEPPWHHSQQAARRGCGRPRPPRMASTRVGAGVLIGFAFLLAVFLSFPNFSTGDLSDFCNWKAAFFILQKGMRPCGAGSTSLQPVRGVAVTRRRLSPGLPAGPPSSRGPALPGPWTFCFRAVGSPVCGISWKARLATPRGISLA